MQLRLVCTGHGLVGCSGIASAETGHAWDTGDTSILGPIDTTQPTTIIF